MGEEKTQIPGKGLKNILVVVLRYFLFLCGPYIASALFVTYYIGAEHASFWLIIVLTYFVYKILALKIFHPRTHQALDAYKEHLLYHTDDRPCVSCFLGRDWSKETTRDELGAVGGWLGGHRRTRDLG